MSDAVLRLPTPLPHQRPVLDSPARYKLWRAGRRTGKSRAGVIASVAGHGPDRILKGVLQGGHIVWLAPDYPQASAIWREEIKPRFSALSLARISESQRRVEIDGLGSLEIRSAEAVDGIRGRKLHGLVVDEAAYQDLEYAWGAVLRPALADHQGWALFFSSPNAGHDGNSAKRRPSYFNMLCQKYAANELSPEWQHWHNRSGDNPKLARDEVIALYAEYPVGSPVSQQELDALLIVGGSGLAFPEFDKQHIVPTRTPPKHWRWAAAMDWGYRQGSYGLYTLGPEGEVEKVWEYYEHFKTKHAREAALAICKASEHFPRPEYIAADEQMWQEVGQSMTLAEEFNQGLWKHWGQQDAPLLQKSEHSPGSRIAKKNLMHRYLAYPKDILETVGTLAPWQRPRLTVQERCRDTIRTMQSLPLDEKKLEDVDTEAEDHGYDETCMMLTSRPPLTREAGPPRNENRHPGFDYANKRVNKDSWQQEEREPGYSIPTFRVPTEWVEE